MEKYKKGGKMPKFLLELFKKKNKKKSMKHGGGMHGGKLEEATRDMDDRIATDTEGLLENLSGMPTSGKEKRFGIVERYDKQGNPYAVKKGLLGETELVTNPLFDPDDPDYVVGKVKNRNKLGRMLTGSDARVQMGAGGKMGKMYSFAHGGKHPEGDDIPALDPNADFLTKDRYVEEPGPGFQDGFLIEGEGPIIKGLTLGSETTNAVAGLPPELATMYLTGGEGKMEKKKEEKPDPKPDPKPEPTPDPIPTRTPQPEPQPEPEPVPVPERTPYKGMTYANVGSYFNPGGERVYRDYGDGDVRAVGSQEHGGSGDRRDLIPTGLRGDDGQAHYASRDVYKMMEAEGIDPYSPEAAMFMEDTYKSNPELFGENYHEAEVMRHRMLHQDKGITQAGREGKDEGFFFPDQLFGRMTPEQRRQQDLANVRAANAARKEAEAERKRKAAEQREKDIAAANARRRAQSRRMAGGGKLFHFGR